MQQLPIVGSLVQVEKSLVPQILDNVLGYEGSGNLGLTFEKKDTEFNDYDLSFFYKTETSGARTLEFDVESNTIVLPPQLFKDKGKVYIGLLGTKQVDDKLVQITTSPARLRVRETVDPNDLDGMPTESEWMEVVSQMVNQLSKGLDDRITKLEQEGTGGGTKDHNKLINRDAENSHPLSAITGLVSALANKLEKTKLGEAITQALAQAKQSGEFNGKNGISPTMSVSQAENGTTFTVTDVNGQKSATIKNGVDGKTPIKGVDYDDGVDGKTPQKGIDYFTPQDKQEIETATFDKLKPSIPTKNSQLENDTKYLTKNEDLMIILPNKREIYNGSKFTEVNLSGFLQAETSLYDDSFNVPVAKHPDTDLLFAKSGSGGSYKLPTASKNTLGGVKVAPYTDEFTQPVSLDPVSQMLRVKQQSGGSSGEKPLELIIDHTVTSEETNAIGIKFTKEKYPKIDGQKNIVFIMSSDTPVNNGWLKIYCGEKTAILFHGASQSCRGVAKVFNNYWLYDSFHTDNKFAGSETLSFGYMLSSNMINNDVYKPYDTIEVKSHVKFLTENMRIQIYAG